MIHEMSDMVVFKIPSTSSLRRVSHWMEENGLEFNKDWEFYGFHRFRDDSYFSLGIKDEGKALLFKLTWVGL